MTRIVGCLRFVFRCSRVARSFSRFGGGGGKRGTQGSNFFARGDVQETREQRHLSGCFLLCIMTDFGNGGARASRETLFGRHIKPSIHITTMIHDAPLEMLLFLPPVHMLRRLASIDMTQDNYHSPQRHPPWLRTEMKN